MKKILVYSHDTYGLGNVRRMLQVVDHLVHAQPDVSVLLVSGAPLIHAFRIPHGADYIKLPCVGRTETAQNVVKSLLLPYGEVMRLRADLIFKAALRFRPDLVLVDKKPLGLANELQPALDALHHIGRPPKTVLLLRDILDAPEATIREWESGRHHQAIAELYDKVLIAGTEEVFDAVREYRFPPHTAAKTQYCGYIARPAPSRPPGDVRRECGALDAPLVVVTAGGGGDGYPLMSAYVDGLAARAARNHRSLLVLGPEMSAGQRGELTRKAADQPGVTVREFSDDMVSAMNAADLVVSMGGYNTVCELLTLRKRAIIVPRAKPVREQSIRAGRMHELGLLRTLDAETLTPRALIEAVEEELSADPAGSTALRAFPMDGLVRIGHTVAELLGLNRAHRRKRSAGAALEAAASRAADTAAQLVAMATAEHAVMSGTADV